MRKLQKMPVAHKHEHDGSVIKSQREMGQINVLQVSNIWHECLLVEY
jgi:hypothetical protein